MVTASDVVPLRLVAAAGVPAEAHGSYRTRPGAGVAVLTTSQLPRAPEGQHYAAWVRQGGLWIAFGDVEPGADGRSLSVAEDGALGAVPEELRVTLERGAVAAPTGTEVLAWRPSVP